MTTEWKHYAQSISIPAPGADPLPGHLAPLDKRHRWRHLSTTKDGDFWYRCTVCKRRKRVRALVNLIARKVRQTAFDMEEKLSETLWTVTR